jgi:5'-nucleotidase
MSRSTSIKSVFVVFVLLLSSVAAAQDYRILVTNDDGIESKLLLALVLELRKIADVSVSAPRLNQSGASQASTSGALQVEEISSNGTLFGYGVTGTPTDAVRYGLRVLGADKPFDLVVSGINLGANVGKVSHMSGTVGAAMQAVYLGVPAIAVSQDTSNVDTTVTARLVSDLVKRYQQHGAPQGTVRRSDAPHG